MSEPEYDVVDVSVDVESALTTEQFRAIERLLQEPLGRHKEWATRYVFTVDPAQPFVVAALAEYLRAQGLPHGIERKEVWSA